MVMARIRAVPRLCWRKGTMVEVVAVDLTPAFPPLPQRLLRELIRHRFCPGGGEVPFSSSFLPFYSPLPPFSLVHLVFERGDTPAIALGRRMVYGGRLTLCLSFQCPGMVRFAGFQTFGRLVETLPFVSALDD